MRHGTVYGREGHWLLISPNAVIEPHHEQDKLEHVSLDCQIVTSLDELVFVMVRQRLYGVLIALGGRPNVEVQPPPVRKEGLSGRERGHVISLRQHVAQLEALVAARVEVTDGAGRIVGRREGEFVGLYEDVESGKYICASNLAFVPDNILEVRSELLVEEVRPEKPPCLGGHLRCSDHSVSFIDEAFTVSHEISRLRGAISGRICDKRTEGLIQQDVPLIYHHPEPEGVVALLSVRCEPGRLGR